MGSCLKQFWTCDWKLGKWFYSFCYIYIYMDLYGSEKTALQILSTDHSLQTQTMCARHDASLQGRLDTIVTFDVTSSCRTLASMPSQESAQSASVTYLSDSSVILALSADFEEDSDEWVSGCERRSSRLSEMVRGLFSRGGPSNGWTWPPFELFPRISDPNRATGLGSIMTYHASHSYSATATLITLWKAPAAYRFYWS